MPLKIVHTGIKENSLAVVETLAKRFYIDDNGCWIWTGKIDKGGYGTFVVNRRYRKAHRVMWELTGNPIDLTLQLDHLCQVTACINPKHLEQVSAKVNTLRSGAVSAINAKKTHCSNGHPLSGDNLRLLPRKKTGTYYRRCNFCFQVSYRKRWLTNRTSAPAEPPRITEAIAALSGEGET